jgi:hypothetical protein
MSVTTHAIGDWISFYNNQRPHQALDIKTPAKAFALAAKPVQIPLGRYTNADKVLLTAPCPILFLSACPLVATVIY